MNTTEIVNKSVYDINTKINNGLSKKDLTNLLSKKTYTDLVNYATQFIYIELNKVPNKRNKAPSRQIIDIIDDYFDKPSPDREFYRLKRKIENTKKNNWFPVKLEYGGELPELI